MFYYAIFWAHLLLRVDGETNIAENKATTTVERCCKESGVSDGCLGMCRVATKDFINRQASGGGYGILGQCDNHIKKISKCRLLGKTDCKNGRWCDVCGEQCFGSPLANVPPLFCENGLRCCPMVNSIYEEECAKTCGPFNPEKTFGSCNFSEAQLGKDNDCSRLCPMDAPCFIDCHQDNKCKYSRGLLHKYVRDIVNRTNIPGRNDCEQIRSEEGNFSTGFQPLDISLLLCSSIYAISTLRMTNHL